MSRWLDDLKRVLDSGEPAEIVSVIGVRGSAPREIGARMLVSRHETCGTIGGGQLEYQCIRRAAKRVAAGGRPELERRRFPLGADCGQCCGGVVDVLFEDVAAARERYVALLDARAAGLPAVLITAYSTGDELRRFVSTDTGDLAAVADGIAKRVDRRGGFTVYEPFGARPFEVAVFGAGHVGSATVALLATLEADVRWIDSRRDVFPRTLPVGVQTLVSPAPWREIGALTPESYVLVMTHSHAMDYDICRAALERRDLAWIGLIGSRSKRRRFEKRFRADNVAYERLVCPIGIGGIRGKKPAEIALAVTAQLIRQRDRAATAGDTRPALIGRA